MAVLVTGVRGKTGRALAAQLAARGTPVRGGSSDPDRVEVAGASPVAFDWAKPATWADALDGVDAVYLVRPDIEDAAERVAAFVAGVPRGARVVLLSELGAEQLPPGHWVARVERSVVDGGRPWTLLRPNWFHQVLTDDRFFRSDIADRGVLSVPSGGAAIGWVDTRDIAAVAVEALTAPGHEEAAYTLTGPGPLRVDEVARLVGAAAGREVRALDPPAAEAIAGAEPWLAAVLSDLYERVRTGVFAAVTDDVRRVTGRSPRSLADFVGANASAWAQSP
jgi:uncharacterized protein YbjT (DUF2867 family)